MKNVKYVYAVGNEVANEFETAMLDVLESEDTKYTVREYDFYTHFTFPFLSDEDALALDSLERGL